MGLRAIIQQRANKYIICAVHTKTFNESIIKMEREKETYYECALRDVKQHTNAQ